MTQIVFRQLRMYALKKKTNKQKKTRVQLSAMIGTNSLFVRPWSPI